MDVRVENHSSIVVLRTESDVAKSWVNDHIGQENGYQPYWPDVVVEPRYVGPILEGMEADGLEVTFR